MNVWMHTSQLMQRTWGEQSPLFRNSPLMLTAGSTMDILGLVVLLCVVAGKSRWS